jgi:hypothetical protein
MEYLILCPHAGLAFHFFLDKKTKQKNQGLQQFNNLNFIKTKCSRVIFEQALNFLVLLSFYFI